MTEKDRQLRASMARRKAEDLRRRGGVPITDGRVWLEVDDAADILGCSLSTVKGWCRRGLLTCIIRVHYNLYQKRYVRLISKASVEQLLLHRLNARVQNSLKGEATHGDQR